MRTKLPLLTIFLLFMSRAFAQTGEKPVLVRPNQIYIGLEGSSVLNFSSFADNRVVDNGFRKPPLPTIGGGLVLRQNLTTVIALETGVSLLKFGYKEVYTSNYPGGKRWEAQSTGTNTFGLFQIPVRGLILLPGKDRYWRKYLSLGANIFYNSYSDMPGNVSSGSTIPGPNPGEKFSFRSTRYPSPRYTTGLSLGAGIERGLWNWGLLQIGAVGNIGLTDLAVWDLEYTTWKINEAVDGITYQNTIVNRGSYFGLQLKVLFGL